MDIKDKIKSYDEFKLVFNKTSKKVDFDEFDKYFHAESFFLNTKIPFIKGRFYEVVFEIIGNVLKNLMQEIEYYGTIKPQTPLTTSDFEIISKDAEQKKILEIYFKFHIQYKKFHKIYLNCNTKTDKVVEFLEEIYPMMIDFIDYSEKLQTKLIKNLEKKYNEIEKKNKEVKFESSVYH